MDGQDEGDVGCWSFSLLGVNAVAWRFAILSRGRGDSMYSVHQCESTKISQGLILSVEKKE